MESEIGDDVPVVGMKFESLDAIIKFYNTYPRRVGFDWRNRSSKKNVDKVVYYVMLVYNQEGKAKSKADETRKTDASKTMIGLQFSSI
ncbi:protein-RELATED SEQUENCE 5-like [Arachis hypogaea]|nr:protein-RELATED SEQUENCE 5-like [Arachis hypogaea]